MSYERAPTPGLGALSQLVATRPQLIAAKAAGSSTALTQPGSPLRAILLLGAVGIGGYLLYRRYKKPTTPAPSSSSGP
jgi:hypothetical protein